MSNHPFKNPFDDNVINRLIEGLSDETVKNLASALGIPPPPRFMIYTHMVISNIHTGLPLKVREDLFQDFTEVEVTFGKFWTDYKDHVRNGQPMHPSVLNLYYIDTEKYPKKDREALDASHYATVLITPFNNEAKAEVTKHTPENAEVIRYPDFFTND